MQYAAIVVAASLPLALLPPGVAHAEKGTDAAPAATDVWLLASPCELYRVERATTPSSLCYSCHDGSVGSSVAHAQAPAYDGNHAVGVSYQQQALGNGHLDLVPRAALASEIVLVEGKVECTSCHAGDGYGPARLALPSAQSALCLACHQK